jgi:TolB-like protein
MARDYLEGFVALDVVEACSRNSTFTYKGRAVDVKQVGRELGVRYVLEGSVRKAAEPLATAWRQAGLPP